MKKIINLLVLGKIILIFCKIAEGVSLNDVKLLIKKLEEEIKSFEQIRDSLLKDKPSTKLKYIELIFENLIHASDRFGNINTYNVKLPCFIAGDNIFAFHVIANQTDLYRVNIEKLSLKDGCINGEIIIYFHSLYSGIVKLRLECTFDNSVNGRYLIDGWQEINVCGERSWVETGEGNITGYTKIIDNEIAIVPWKEKDILNGDIIEDKWEYVKYLDLKSSLIYQQIKTALISREYNIPYSIALLSKVELERIYPSLPPTKQSSSSKSKTAFSLEDIDELGEETDLEIRNKKKPSEAGNNADFLYKRVSSIIDKVKKERRYVECAIKSSEDNKPVTCIDAIFCDNGPWYGNQALPIRKESNIVVNVLQVGSHQNTIYNWPWVTGWKVLGPFKAFNPALVCFRLPDFIPDEDVKYKIVPEVIKYRKGRDKNTLSESCIVEGDIEAGTGYVRLKFPGIEEEDKPEIVNCSWYGISYIYSDEDREIWAGTTVADYGKLWVNGKLVWQSSLYPENGWICEKTYVFKMKLNKGINELIYRCDNEKDDSYFNLRICTACISENSLHMKGEKAEKFFNNKPEDLFKGVYGWRKDGTGVYPDTSPPVVWDIERGINVLWRKKLKYGHATPVVAGDKLIVTEHPHTLVCFNKLTGEELWRTDCDIVLTKNPQIQAEAEKVKMMVKDVEKELEALGNNHDERLQNLMNTGLSKEQAEEQIKEKTRRLSAYEKFLEEKCGAGNPGWGNIVGNAYATPITDGKYIWFKSNTGALGCFDLNGKLKWIVDYECPVRDCSATTSPLLVDGKIIIFVPAMAGKFESFEKEVKPGKGNKNIVRAYDAETGAHLWTAPTYIRGMMCGTPAVLRLTNGKEIMYVIVTPNGTVLRANDGKVLRTYIGEHELYGSPLRVGNDIVIISSHHRKAAYQLIMKDRDTVGVKTLWFRQHPNVFQDGNYGVYWDGKLYYSRPLVDITDLKTGELLWISANVFFTRPGRGYPPCAIAGNKLFVADNGTWFQPTYRPYLSEFPAGLSVLDLEFPPLVLAKNQIEQISGGFSFDGDRIYIRGFCSITCIGYTEEGRKYEAITVAKEVLSDVYPDVPSMNEPVDIPYTGKVKDVKFSVNARIGERIMCWLFAEIKEEDISDGVIDRLNDLSWEGYLATDKREIVIGGSSISFRLLDSNNLNLWAVDNPFRISQRKNFSKGPHTGWEPLMGEEIDITRLVKDNTTKLVLLVTLINSSKDELARLSCPGKGFSIWVGGKKVTHNTLLKFSGGFVPVVICLKLGDYGLTPIHIKPYFWKNSVSNFENWKKQIIRRKIYLENVINIAPDSDMALKAKEFLNVVK